MNPFNLKNNALFLSCWHERMRPVQLACISILILSILLLAALSAMVSGGSNETVLGALFIIVVGVQSLVLLLQGTLFASNMASRERICETLDFHRNSPQAAGEKVLGLVLGSTWFEWMVFFILFLVELPFAFLPNIDLRNILLVNISFLMSGALFHSTAVLIALISAKKQRVSPLVGIFLLIWVIGPMVSYMFMASPSPFFAHLFGVTAFSYVNVEQVFHFNGRFFVFEFPLIVMQAAAQLPILLMVLAGIRRIFLLPNSPAWSKEEVLQFCLFIFLMMVGFFVADYSHVHEILDQKSHGWRYVNSVEGFLRHEVGGFTFLYVAIGMLVSFFAVPSFFKRSKFLMLSRSSGGGKAMLDDGASAFFTVMIYVLIGAFFMTPYLSAMGVTWVKGIAYLLIVSSYVVAASGFLEFFRLGRFRKNMIFFVTAILIWWLVIPWVAMITSRYGSSEPLAILIISPFFGIKHASEVLAGEAILDIPALAVACLVAGSMWALAGQEHRAIRKEVLR